MNLIYTFLGLMKSNAKIPDEISTKHNDRRFSVFLDVFKPLYVKYEAQLHKTSQVDFNDMINQAAEHIYKGILGSHTNTYLWMSFRICLLEDMSF